MGTTGIAVNLAATLAADPSHNVGLLDLDLALGDADIAVELPGSENISIADLARNIERLDMNFLRRAMVKHPETGLSILRHPLELTEVGTVHEGHVERIINLLEDQLFAPDSRPEQGDAADRHHGLAHVGHHLAGRSAGTEFAAKRRAHDSHAESRRRSGRQASSRGQPVRVRTPMEDGITIKKAEEVIGKPIFWQIPNDSKVMLGSRVAGMPLIKFAPKAGHNKVFKDWRQR